MTTKQTTKLIHEGEFVAEVDVDLIITADEWSPYLSLQDANKLDDVRLALRRGDLETAAKLARVFRLIPVAM
ncbi:MAG: hypothetical protein KBF17_10850 [Candidatus Promineofilum sp.]|nr:hypothetical protein [Promineifilum sp.]